VNFARTRRAEVVVDELYESLQIALHPNRSGAQRDFLSPRTLSVRIVCVLDMDVNKIGAENLERLDRIAPQEAPQVLPERLGRAIAIPRLS